MRVDALCPLTIRAAACTLALIVFACRPASIIVAAGGEIAAARADRIVACARIDRPGQIQVFAVVVSVGARELVRIVPGWASATVCVDLAISQAAAAAQEARISATSSPHTLAREIACAMTAVPARCTVAVRRANAAALAIDAESVP